MSKLKEKSKFNIDAAQMLLNNALYAPSVHCSYYSCFQLMKHTIKYFFGVDYDTQSANISTSKQQTHQYVISYIFNELHNFVDRSECLKFRRKIKDLKQYRTESDYANIEVGVDKGKEALDKAKDIRTYMINNFNV